MRALLGLLGISGLSKVVHRLLRQLQHFTTCLSRLSH